MIAACVKWVAADPEQGDERFAGVSAADQAAVELALRQAAAAGDECVVVTAGPAVADAALRDALAAGAARAVRVELPLGAASGAVAAALAEVVRDAAFVWCGDYSPDRGTGSVPAFLAAELDARQALGVVAVDLGDAATVEVTRRLDGGRREVLAVAAPAVVSVEGAVARLRRAGLAAVLAARTAPIEVRRPAPAVAAHDPAPTVHAYRPRARALPAPQGSTLDRLRALTDAGGATGHGEIVHLEPADAADRIVATLRTWGYLDPDR